MVIDFPAVRKNCGNDRLKVFVLFNLIAVLTGCHSSPAFSADPQVCFEKKCFTVEVVYKKEELERGLKFRTNLKPDAGMFFVFPASQIYPFWMKETKIPLDMIWFDYKREVVYIQKNALPCQQDPCQVYTPDREAMYVLEVNSGIADQFAIHPGETAEFKLNLDLDHLE